MASAPVLELTVNVSGQEGLKRVESGLEAVNRAAAGVNATTRVTEAATTQLDRTTRSLGGAYDALKRSLDPLHAASERLRRGQDLVNRAFNQGKIDAAEQARMLAMLQGNYDGAAAAARRFDAANDNAAIGGGRGRQLLFQGTQVVQQAMAGGMAVLPQALAMQALDVGPMLIGSLGLGAGGKAMMAIGGAFAALAAYGVHRFSEELEQDKMKLSNVIVGAGVEAWRAFQGATKPIWDELAEAARRVGTFLVVQVQEGAAFLATAASVIGRTFLTIPEMVGEGVQRAWRSIVGMIDGLLVKLNQAHVAINNLMPWNEKLATADTILGAPPVPLAGTTADLAKKSQADIDALTKELEKTPEERMQAAWDTFERWSKTGEQKIAEWKKDKAGSDASRVTEAERETERATELAAKHDAETQALQRKAEAFALEGKARDDAVRKIERELQLRHELAALDKATPASRAKVEKAFRAKAAAEDSLRAAQADAELRKQIAEIERESAANRERAGVERGMIGDDKETVRAREAALRQIERRMELERAMAQVSVDASEKERDAYRAAFQERQNTIDQLEKERRIREEVEEKQKRMIPGAFREYFHELYEETKTTGEALVEAFDRSTQMVAATITDFITGTKVSLKELGAELTRMLAELAVQQAMAMGLKAAGTAIFGAPAPAPSAMGNVFSGGNIIPFARGGVVDRATLRPMALMGEAGPEAVMPLKRTPDGRLGVEASGGGGGGNVITLNTAVNVQGGMKGDAAEQERIAAQAAATINRHLEQVIDRRLAEHNRPGATLNRRRAF